MWTGYEPAQRVRALDATKGALLLAASGFGQKEDHARSAQAGVDRHLVKPVDIDALTQPLSNAPARADM